MRFRHVVLRALLAIYAAGAPHSVRSQEDHPAAIPVDVNVQYVPQPVAAEDAIHIVYELRLTNFNAADLSLQRIDVFDDAANRLLTSYTADSLNDIIARPGTRGLQDRRIIGPGLSAVAFIDVQLERSAHIPARLRHRLTFAPIKPPNGPVQSIVDAPVVVVPRNSRASFGPPLRGSGWLASHALSNASVHRRTLLAVDGRARDAQRFAIDFTRIGADGQVFRGDPAMNSNWTPYGAEVLAIANGRVVEIQDGIPENNPAADTKAVEITLKNAGGNHLVLDLGDGRYAIYAHLQPHSFRVHAGDRVKEGDVLARLGNSGQSDAPHLHLEITNAPSMLASEGLPLTFRRFELLGHVPSLRVLADGTGWRASGKPVVRTNEMPIENAVVRFER